METNLMSLNGSTIGFRPKFFVSISREELGLIIPIFYSNGEIGLTQWI